VPIANVFETFTTIMLVFFFRLGELPTADDMTREGIVPLTMESIGDKIILQVEMRPADKPFKVRTTYPVHVTIK
jgi:hypothetical protein